MEEKKILKISLSTFLLIIAIILIIVMAIFMYKLYNKATEANEKLAELQIRENTSNEVDGNLTTNTINNITNNTTASNSTNNVINIITTNNEYFTNEQIRTVLANYLELYNGLHSDMLLQTLNKKGKLNYDITTNWEMLNDGTQVTNIKFSDYKKAMLNYVSESEFEKNWNCFGVNKEGYITKLQGGGGSTIYTINEINKIDDLTYYAKTKYTTTTPEEYNHNQDFTFTVRSYNGNCVIDTIKTVNEWEN